MSKNSATYYFYQMAEYLSSAYILDMAHREIASRVSAFIGTFGPTNAETALPGGAPLDSRASGDSLCLSWLPMRLVAPHTRCSRTAREALS
jgi:hypothetical protein